jgi:hypothetical protein
MKLQIRESSFDWFQTDEKPVKFNRTMRDLVNVGSIFIDSQSAYRVVSIQKIRNNINVTLETIADAPDKRWKTKGKYIYSEPLSELYGTMFIE